MRITLILWAAMAAISGLAIYGIYAEMQKPMPVFPTTAPAPSNAYLSIAPSAPVYAQAQVDADKRNKADEAARAEAERFMLEKMKAPTQSSVYGSKIILAKPGLRWVVVVIDAPNTFGVMLRESFTVALIISENSAEALALNFADGAHTGAEIQHEIDKAERQKRKH